MSIEPKRSLVAALLLLATSLPAVAADVQPTVILVHGAFAESASWNQVIERLQDDGYPVIAAANPLRGVQKDAATVGALVESIDGPVILVGHSYGGMVISNAARPNVEALVFVAAFAPEAGETADALTRKFPGSVIADALGPPVPLPDGVRDLYIRQDRFPTQFAGDVDPAMARAMAVTQRPIAESAFTDASATPAWKSTPSWFVYGDRDLEIPPAVQAFMAGRAGSRKTVVVPGASHVVMISHPDVVAAQIEAAAESVVPE